MMKLIPLLAFALVGGYAFSTIWAPSLFHSARESGHRLYFRALFYTSFLLSISLAVHILLFVSDSTREMYVKFLNFIGHFTNVEIEDLSIFSLSSKISIVSMSLILGPALGHLLNFPKWGIFINLCIPTTNIRPFFQFDKFVLGHAIKNNDFEKLIARSVYTNIPILFTLDTGKVYAGWAVRAPNPVQERKAVRILPLLSGYRHKETHKVFFTTDYYKVLHGVQDGSINHIELSDIEVVILIDEISSCHLFDLAVYSYFNEEKSSIELIK